MWFRDPVNKFVLFFSLGFRSCLSEPFSFDADAVTNAVDRLLGECGHLRFLTRGDTFFFTVNSLNRNKVFIIASSTMSGGKDEELDSDDFDEDEEDDDDGDDEAEGEGSEEQTETLDNLRRYMDEMDRELQSTNVGQSFTHNGKVSVGSSSTINLTCDGDRRRQTGAKTKEGDGKRKQT